MVLIWLLPAEETGELDVILAHCLILAKAPAQVSSLF